MKKEECQRENLKKAYLWRKILRQQALRIRLLKKKEKKSCVHLLEQMQ
jgi:hypothetical protein